MIDWSSRFRNKQFLAAIVSLAILIIKNTMGYDFLPPDIDLFADLILTLVTAMGVVVDPTTGGWSDEIETSDPRIKTLDSILDSLKVLTNENLKD